MDQFKRAEHVLAGVRQAEEQLRREIERKVDWEDTSDVRVYRRECVIRAREKIIDLVAPGRVCPCCKTVKPDPRVWVINRRGTKAVCRSCFQRVRIQVDGVKCVEVKIFPGVTRRYKIDGKALKRARMSVKCTASEFARLVGWSSAYQNRVESYYTDIGEEAAHGIMAVLEKIGVMTDDVLEEGKSE